MRALQATNMPASQPPSATSPRALLLLPPPSSRHSFLQRHLEIADVPGKFVAHTNLGLVEAAAGNFSAAAVNHRLALRCAIILRSIEGEALACGNLGVASRSADFMRHFAPEKFASSLSCVSLRLFASAGGDTETARQCMQRYLKLAATLHDSSAQARAQEGLGKLAAAGERRGLISCDPRDFSCDAWFSAGLHSEARQCFESARELARSISHAPGPADTSAPSAAETKMEVCYGVEGEGWDMTCLITLFRSPSRGATKCLMTSWPRPRRTWSKHLQ